MRAVARRLSLMLGVGMLLLLQACATVKSADASDPWEPMNRSIYQFNDGSTPWHSSLPHSFM